VASRVLSWSKQVGIRTIRAAHSHSPTNLRPCPFLCKECMIPTLRTCKIRIRTACHFTLPKALMSPGCRTSASHSRRQGFSQLIVLHRFRLISPALLNRRCQCTHPPTWKPSEYSWIWLSSSRLHYHFLLGSLSQAGHNQTHICLL
jgi:hypothetical protein